MTVKKISDGVELTTSAVDVYVVPTSFVTDIETIIVCNKTNSTKTVTLQWYNASDTHTHSLLNTTDVPSYSFVRIEKPLYLEAGDKLIALASANSAVDLSFRAQEQFTPIRSS
jgi:hypothetical protein